MNSWPFIPPKPTRTCAPRSWPACATSGSLGKCAAWARLTERSEGKAYQYFFSHVPPTPNRAEVGAYHAAEILYVFNNLAKVDWALSAVDTALADAVSNAWVRFAATGDPNGGAMPQWRPYDAASQSYLDMGDTLAPGTNLLQAQCDFFDKFYAAKRTKP